MGNYAIFLTFENPRRGRQARERAIFRKLLLGAPDVCPGLEIVTDTVASVTNIVSLATKNSGSVAPLVTRFLYDLDLNCLE